AEVSAKNQPVDIVFTLDLSGSTNGLIDDVRDNLWGMNNELNRLYPSSQIRFAVVGYSRPSFGSKNQYVKVLSPFTSDIDNIATELYKLKPNIEKGDQYVGAAIRASLDMLSWSNEKNAVKQIFLTGNGSVFLGAFDVVESCNLAKEKGISVNALYCYSSLRAKDISGWYKISEITGGKSIDVKVHKRLPDYATVTDISQLQKLASELNKTYIYYGKTGRDSYKAMVSNEKNAMNARQSTFEDLLYHKISDRYQGKQNEWDLVDYIKSRNGNLKNIDAAFLPDSLKKINPEQLLTKLLILKERRNYLISQIRQLLPFERQDKLTAYFNSKQADSDMIFDRQVMKVLKDEMQSDLAVN
ncbi:MAG TPA: VWA domain-containing protein, partial [Bacteroidia bacterium]|nr:VWA domain-containing protein [Bacteroidia bacterium]